ncbi:dTDP-4-dehydrorhamnose reductase [Candidatus Pelagibacter sp.]|uniref:dTDP-4-dehydrorhamnose reductase n=1 Tax=Candidatus Pelagibacter sp. TaxID=2024849 RepID=UPI003D1333F6
MKILVIGANGQIGSSLIKELKNHNVEHVNKEQLDCTNLEAVKNYFINKSYDYVINAVAYTKVDQAEVDTDKAKLLNATYPNELSKILKKMNCALIHYSTDYVFDGTKTSDYFEQSIPNPLNIYGKTKLLGDLSILRQKINGYILRVSFVYGNKDHSFLNKIQKQIDKKNPLRVVEDQVGTPTSSIFIAKITRQLIELKNIKPIKIYNLSPKEKCSWFDFAKEYLRLKNIKTSIKNIETDLIQQNAKRPRLVKLNSSKLEQLLQISLPSWRQVLKDYLDER